MSMVLYNIFLGSGAAFIATLMFFTVWYQCDWFGKVLATLGALGYILLITISGGLSGNYLMLGSFFICYYVFIFVFGAADKKQKPAECGRR